MIHSDLPPQAEISIRNELPEDAPAVRNVLEQAFERAGEADLVDALRAGGNVTLALVASTEAGAVGHILYSPVRITGDNGETGAVGLGPLAVLPEIQNQGVGSTLIRTSLNLLRQSGTGAVIVLGHPEYYTRFGFKRASNFGIKCEFEVPEEAFMVLELRPNALQGVTGTVYYAPEFGSVA